MFTNKGFLVKKPPGADRIKIVKLVLGPEAAAAVPARAQIKQIFVLPIHINPAESSIISINALIRGSRSDSRRSGEVLHHLVATKSRSAVVHYVASAFIDCRS